MKPDAYVSVDPGAKGSFCVLVPSSKQIGFFPTISKPMDIMDWFTKIKMELNPQIIMIENVHAIFGTSAGSNFKFGYNVGLVNALSEASGIGVAHVTPKMWQKKIGVTKKGKAIKQDVAAICERLYPYANIRGPKGGLLDGLSDSLMIAHFARLQYTGK